MADHETVGVPAGCLQVAPESGEITMLPAAPTEGPPVVTASREPSAEEATDVEVPTTGEVCAIQVAPESVEI